MKFKFYVAMTIVVGGLLGNALWQCCDVQHREEVANLQRYETLSYQECAARFLVMEKVLSVAPRDWNEYYTNLGRAYMLVGAANKAMQHTLPVPLTPENDRDQMMTREISTKIPAFINDYQSLNPELLASNGRSPEWQAAHDAFERTGQDQLIHRNAPAVSGSERLGLWWFLFHVGSMPFIFIHYCIRIRQKGMKIRFEILGNPKFPLWLFAWEIGLFRYPTEVSVIAQLQRARQWAALVLSSALPCFAANAGKTTCKKDPTPVRWSANTSTLSSYLGLDGGVFYLYPVQQSSGSVSLPCGVYGSVWYSEPLSHRGITPNYGREMDTTLGWGTAAMGTSLDFSATYLNVSPFLQLPRGDVFQLSERVSKKLSFDKRNAVSPYLWFREAVPVRGSTPVGGWFVHGGTTFSDSFGKDLSNAATVEVLRDSGAFGYKEGYIGRAMETPSWKLGKHFSLQFPLVVTTPLSHTGDGRRTRVAGGLILQLSH